jgi:hypothetical protein
MSEHYPYGLKMSSFPKPVQVELYGLYEKLVEVLGIDEHNKQFIELREQFAILLSLLPEDLQREYKQRVYRKQSGVDGHRSRDVSY